MRLGIVVDMTRGRLLIVGVSVLLVAVAVTTTEQGEELLHDLPAAERFYTRFVPPEPPEIDDQINALEIAALEALAPVGGRLVWSSNRGGNHDLYLAELSTGSVRRITDHPHVDYFSRFSPDGMSISFLRSRRPWVSFREEDAWDLFVMNADGTNVRRLAEHAYHPTWKPDGSGLVFLRDNTIRDVDLDSGRERLLQDGSVPPLDGRIGDPEIASDGRMTVTVRRRAQRVGVLDADRVGYAFVSDPRACHIAWMPGEDRVLWVSGEGHGGTRIMHGRPGTVGGEVLIDLPGQISHEYFPRVVRDSRGSPENDARRWLVWGATAEGHEHDRADYEIFVWELGTPWESALRVTHSTGNDQWPDLFIGDDGDDGDDRR